MAKQPNFVEVEICGSKNQGHYFRPLGRTLRGRFDLHRVNEPNAGKLIGTWPEPIPGQRIALNLETGEGSVVEPLRFSENESIRQRIEAKGLGVAKERESYTADVPTWVYWLKSAVDAGVATVVGGALPTSIDGQPRLRFHSNEQPDPVDRLTAAIERQSELQAETLRVLTKLMAERN